MAQHFFDMRIGKPGNWPSMLKGEVASYNEAQSIGNFTSEGFQISSISNSHKTLLCGITPAANVDIVHRVSYSTRTANTDFTNTGMAAVAARASGVSASGRPSNCYYATLNATTSASSNGDALILYKIVSGTQTVIHATQNVISDLPSLMEAKQTDVYIRLNCNGTNIRAKAWKVSDAEPASWQREAVDSDLASGDAGVIYHGYGLEMVSKFVSVGTGSDNAPFSYPGGNRIVTGTLLKPDNSPADGYLVRCYHRETGCLLGETLANLSGAFTFSLPIPITEKVYCVGVDQLGNSWNAPIKDLIQPVSP